MNFINLCIKSKNTCKNMNKTIFFLILVFKKMSNHAMYFFLIIYANVIFI